MASAALLGLTNFNSPLLRNIVPCAATSFAIQYAVGLPSTFLAKPPTERYYDLSGAITNVAVVALSLLLPRWRAAEAGGDLGPPNWHQIALSGAVAIWAARLGTYLFRRILREGKDSRFDAMRVKPARMMIAWTAQAVWVIMCQLPVMAVNTVSPAIAYYPSYILPSDTLGLGLFAFGLAFESLADWQKATWVAARDAKEHDEVFISSGLFGQCQYPHYFGEMTLWTGLAIAAAGVLTRAPVQASLGGISTLSALALAFASPAFTIYVLVRVSGIQLSQRKYDRKYYGRRKDYSEWRDKTPLLIPRFT
ncbi:hypothetical protein SEUCBS139899_000250 [Sporothrix eucalyptigena]|uniref:Steroid 5-alpha reductase C-terminal domain-containing protein n=1 Tax=Sporothrix eucalyptigena TaxID=1812306 RepID=A0ABP0BLG7_9PEZI